ncbi:conserved hypothetical protein [Ricinus communis]|uniref:Uncharacterized protein n=1 Tax=Ricinus communis TaxID=3988 RepID=B9RH29_RICCO|nr:conserved hypothetical protein [Ricinus communis]
MQCKNGVAIKVPEPTDPDAKPTQHKRRFSFFLSMSQMMNKVVPISYTTFDNINVIYRYVIKRLLNLVTSDEKGGVDVDNYKLAKHTAVTIPERLDPDRRLCATSSY